MARTTDALIVYGEDETAVYLPGSKVKLEPGHSVLTPDGHTGIVQAIYPSLYIVAVAIPRDGRFIRMEYAPSRLHMA